jgi:hypothetical protein
VGTIQKAYEWQALTEDMDVLFSRSVEGTINLWKYNLNDRSLSQVTFGSGPDYAPMPGPRGIYYVSGKMSGSLAQYSKRTNSSTEIVSAFVIGPTLSPDAKKVMYRKVFDDSSSEAWVSDLDGSNAVRIMGSGDWSHDSSWIAFDDSGKIYICRPDGKNLRQVADIEGRIHTILWSADLRALYVSFSTPSKGYCIWKANVDGSKGELLKTNTIFPNDVSPDGRYILGTTWKDSHIIQMSIATKEETMLLPEVSTFIVHVSEDRKSFLYGIEGSKETTFYRQGWEDGKLIGRPEVVLKLPFPIPFEIMGSNGYDFSRDLSTVVYTKPMQQADLYLVSYSQQ